MVGLTEVFAGVVLPVGVAVGELCACQIRATVSPAASTIGKLSRKSELRARIPYRYVGAVNAVGDGKPEFPFL